jgi:hypothetical protein
VCSGSANIEIEVETTIGLFPKLSGFAEDSLVKQISDLSAFIMKATGCNLDELNPWTTDGQTEGEEGDDDFDDDDDDSALEFVIDIYTGVQCLMELIPSMEQTLRHQQAVSSTISRGLK